MGRTGPARDLERGRGDADEGRSSPAVQGRPVAAIGITNRRETVVAWDRRTGRPLCRAIVWQDRRTSERCDQLRNEGHLPLIQEKTGLILDPYFSATKMEWLLTRGRLEPNPNLVLGTVDTWLMWNLTGGVEGGTLATEPSNASRTLLMDIHDLSWSEELCELFSVPMSALPEVHPSCGRFSVVGGVADKMEPDNLRGQRRVIEVAIHRLTHPRAQFLDRLSLSGNAVAQCRSAIAPLLRVRDLKNDFRLHCPSMPCQRTNVKAPFNRPEDGKALVSWPASWPGIRPFGQARTLPGCSEPAGSLPIQDSGPSKSCLKMAARRSGLRLPCHSA